jgi:Mrp family chromosome partitioning ATPase
MYKNGHSMNGTNATADLPTRKLTREEESLDHSTVLSERLAEANITVLPPPSREVSAEVMLPEEPVTKSPAEYVSIRIEPPCESFTHLHTAIEYATSSAAIRTEELADASLFQSGRPIIIGVTSAIAGEGKTTVALHLAMDIARNNYKKVCLIDMALDSGSLSQRLGINAGPGLVEVLEGRHHTIPTLESNEIEGLCVMPSGKSPGNAARAARSPAVAEVLAASRELFDVIIVDLPAVGGGNALPIMPHLDAYILVTLAGVTPRDVIQEALQRVGKNKLLGVVLNRVASPLPRWMQKRLRRG